MIKRYVIQKNQKKLFNYEGGIWLHSKDCPRIRVFGKMISILVPDEDLKNDIIRTGHIAPSPVKYDLKIFRKYLSFVETLEK